MASSPTFFLYGEPPRATSDGFLHLEPLDTRSRPANWHIRSHRHENLHHVFMLSGGSGEMKLEDRRVRFSAPCLLLVPAGVIHAFVFAQETTGHVLTLSAALMGSLMRRDPDFLGLFNAAVSLPASPEGALIQERLSRLDRELAWRAPGHLAAVDALVQEVLVIALRRRRREDRAADPEQSSEGRLIARLREQVELRFRRHESVEAYAEALGVSVSRLRTACRKFGSGSPLELIHARQMLEAKRALLYGHMNVADVAWSLGFDDPAYFIRLFRRREGLSPGQFRGRRSLEPVLT